MFPRLTSDEARYEEEQVSDYGNDEILDDEEELPLLSTKTVRPASWLPLLICVCICMTGLGLKLSYDLRPLNSEAFSLISNASAATYEHVHTFETLDGGSISLYKVQWQDQTWETEDTYICHYQGICIEQHEDVEAGSTKREYWLMGEPPEEISSIAGIDGVASDAFVACLGHPSSNTTTHSLGIKNVRNHEGDMSWVGGSTLTMHRILPATGESGDSLARLRAWSRFMSLGTNASPDLWTRLRLSTKAHFKHVLYIDETPNFSHWQNTIIRVANSAAYAGIVQPRLSAMLKLSIRNKKWMNQHVPKQEVWDQEALVAGEAVCFSNMIMIAPSKQFFRNREDANYFRSWAYHRAGIPQERSIPTHLKHLKAVVLLRPDRPLWHYKRLAEIMNETGIYNIKMTTITHSTTSATHIDLWSNADIVISDDHDALSGQALMRPGAAVLEIFPALTYDDSHEMLAVKTGVHYVPATTAELVSADIVHEEDATALPKLSHARYLAHKHSNQKACQSSAECQQAMSDLGAYIDEPHFRAGLRDLLRIMAPAGQSMGT